MRDAGATSSDAGTDAGSMLPDAGHPQPPIDAGLPYLLPAAGDVLTIGTNTVADLASVFPGYDTADLQTAVFSSFGSGTFIRDYSVHGAYVFACLGGHASPPELTGAVLFDFDDATWKGFENTNGVPSALTGPGAAIAASNGMPWYEYTGTEVPLPGHPYLIPAELPASLGGGPKGSFLMTGRAAVDESGGGGRGPHALDLSTMRWSRLTSADEVRVGGIDSAVVFDEDAGRYYGIGGDITCCKSIPYFQASDWSVVNNTSPEYGYGSDPAGSQSSAFLDPVHRLIVDFRFDGTSMFLTALDLNQVGLGWQTLPVSGQLPALPGESQRWVFYPPDGHFYYREQVDGGSTLNRLKLRFPRWRYAVGRRRGHAHVTHARYDGPVGLRLHVLRAVNSAARVPHRRELEGVRVRSAGALSEQRQLAGRGYLRAAAAAVSRRALCVRLLSSIRGKGIGRPPRLDRGHHQLRRFFERAACPAKVEPRQSGVNVMQQQRAHRDRAVDRGRLLIVLVDFVELQAGRRQRELERARRVEHDALLGKGLLDVLHERDQRLRLR